MGFLTIFSDFERIHVSKDVGQVNRLTADYLKIKPYILSYCNEKLDDKLVSYIKIKEHFRRKAGNKLDLNIVLFLLSKSRNFKYLNLYHQTFCTQIYAVIYKLLNPRGKVYVKLDLDVEYEKCNIEARDSFLRKSVKNFVFHWYAKVVDVVSAESMEGCDIISAKNIYSPEKLINITNGVSKTDIYNNYGDFSYDDKQDIFLTIGRIGTEQKCNELMLTALSLLDLKNWKFIFVGSIEEDFLPKIDNFYNENPSLRQKVFFLGPKDRAEIYDLYKSAKVFTLSSIREGFPLVFAEASFYGCYIITTAVSGSVDITRDGTIGDIIPIGDHVLFSKAMERIIASDVSIDKFNNVRNYAIENYTWENIIPTLAKKLTNG